MCNTAPIEVGKVAPDNVCECESNSEPYTGGILKTNCKVVRRYKAGYEIREEDWQCFPDDATTKMRQAYTPSGDYIGDTKSAYRLCVKRGIKPELAKPSHGCCSIGFSEKTQKWYGWSHRAIFGFGIGSTVKKGDCAYVPATPQELFDELTMVDEDGHAGENPENIEILPNGIRVRIQHMKLKEEYRKKFNESNSTTSDCLAETSDISVKVCAAEPIPKDAWEPAEPEYYEVECGKGEWTAKTLEDAKQMAIDFAESVS